MALHTSNPLTKTQMNLAPFSNWTSGFPYNTGDFVLHSTGIWKATRNNIADVPTSTSTSWTLELGGGGGGGTPGGVDMSVQYNSTGTFDGFGKWDETLSVTQAPRLTIPGEIWSHSTAETEPWWNIGNTDSQGNISAQYAGPKQFALELLTSSGADYGFEADLSIFRYPSIFASDDGIGYNSVTLESTSNKNAFFPSRGTPDLGSSSGQIWGRLFITATTSDPGVLGQVYSGALNALFISTGP